MQKEIEGAVMKIFDIIAFIAYILFCVLMFIYLLVVNKVVFGIIFFILAGIVLYYTIVNKMWN